MDGSNGRRVAIVNRFDGKREEKVPSTFEEKREMYILEKRVVVNGKSMVERQGTRIINAIWSMIAPYLDSITQCVSRRVPILHHDLKHRT